MWGVQLLPLVAGTGRYITRYMAFFYRFTAEPNSAGTVVISRSKWRIDRALSHLHAPCGVQARSQAHGLALPNAHDS